MRQRAAEHELKPILECLVAIATSSAGDTDTNLPPPLQAGCRNKSLPDGSNDHPDDTDHDNRGNGKMGEGTKQHAANQTNTLLSAQRQGRKGQVQNAQNSRTPNTHANYTRSHNQATTTRTTDQPTTSCKIGGPSRNANRTCLKSQEKGPQDRPQYEPNLRVKASTAKRTFSQSGVVRVLALAIQLVISGLHRPITQPEMACMGQDPTSGGGWNAASAAGCFPTPQGAWPDGRVRR